MGKIVLIFLFVFATISSSFSLPSPSNSSPNPNPRETKNVEEKMEELENFHAEFKDFKSSLVELSAAFGRFHQSVVAAANGSSTKPEQEKLDSQSLSSCSDAMEILSSPRSQKQRIYPHGNRTSLEVLCDFENDGGGWTIIQKRSSGPKYEFNQNWKEYVKGVGALDKNFWLGLENIRALTQTGDQELRIEVAGFDGNKAWAQYSSFSIADAADFYRLSISGYSGSSTAGDSMTSSTRQLQNLNGMRFHTTDNTKLTSCHVARTGGWWFKDCGTMSNLNGNYRTKGSGVSKWERMIWGSWKGETHYLAKTEMKIRKKM